MNRQLPYDAVYVASIADEIRCPADSLAHAIASEMFSDDRIHPLGHLFLQRRSQIHRIILGGCDGMLASLSLKELSNFRAPESGPIPLIDDSTCASSRAVETRAPVLTGEVIRHSQRALSSLLQIIPIERRIDLQRTIRRILKPVCHRLRNDFGPLLNSATSDANRSRHGGSVAIVMGENVGLSHSNHGTAC